MLKQLVTDRSGQRCLGTPVPGALYRRRSIAHGYIIANRTTRCGHVGFAQSSNMPDAREDSRRVLTNRIQNGALHSTYTYLHLSLRGDSQERRAHSIHMLAKECSEGTEAAQSPVPSQTSMGAETTAIQRAESPQLQVQAANRTGRTTRHF